jgi:hypothetical protein
MESKWNLNGVPFRNTIVNTLADKYGQGGLAIFCPSGRLKNVRVISQSYDWAIIEVKDTIICTMYYAPSQEMQVFLDFMHELEEASQIWNRDVILAGDFNARFLDMTGDNGANARGKNFFKVMENFPLLLLRPEEGASHRPHPRPKELQISYSHHLMCTNYVEIVINRLTRQNLRVT